MYKVLTPREREIFTLLIDNYSTKQIAEKLNVSEKTIRNHISNVILKLDAKGRTQALVKLLYIGELKIKANDS